MTDIRLDKYNIIRNSLESIQTTSHDICINDFQDFRYNLKDIRKIGYGRNVNVFSAKLNKEKFAVKEVMLLLV
jgi:hypothetical protein